MSDGSGLVATYGAGDKSIKVWDQATGEAVGEPFPGDLNHPVPLWLPSRTGPCVGFASYEKGVRRWSARSGDLVKWPVTSLLGGRPARARSAITLPSPRGRTLVATTYSTEMDRERTVKIWDAVTGRARCRLGRRIRLRQWSHISAMSWFTGARGAPMIVTAGSVILVWNAATGRRSGKKIGKRGKWWKPGRVSVKAVAALKEPDGTVLVATLRHYGQGPPVQIWNATAGELLTEHDAGHTGPVNAILALPRNFVTAGDDGTLRIWAPRTGEIHTVKSTDQPLHSLALSEGATLYTAGPAGLTAYSLNDHPQTPEPPPQQP